MEILINPNYPVLSQLCGVEDGDQVSFDPTGLTDRQVKAVETEIFAAFGQVKLLRQVLGMHIDGWIQNAFINYPTLLAVPSADTLPQTIRGKALIVGNGPTALDVHKLKLHGVKVFSCWHAAHKLPQSPDYIIHIDRCTPDRELGFQDGDYSQSAFIGGLTVSPEFFETAKAHNRPVYGFLDCENVIDSLFAGALNQPLLGPSAGTVITACIHSAILAGCQDIRLIGVDLQDADGTPHPCAEMFTTCLEYFPRQYPHIRFTNFSLSTLKGYQNKGAPNQ